MGGQGSLGIIHRLTGGIRRRLYQAAKNLVQRLPAAIQTVTVLCFIKLRLNLLDQLSQASFHRCFGLSQVLWPKRGAPHKLARRIRVPETLIVYQKSYNLLHDSHRRDPNSKGQVHAVLVRHPLCSRKPYFPNESLHAGKQ